MDHTRTLARMRRRLERAELDLLRQVVAEQAARIEALEAELARANYYAAWADDRAEMFLDMANAMAEQTDAHIGLTRAGEVGVMPAHVAY